MSYLSYAYLEYMSKVYEQNSMEGACFGFAHMARRAISRGNQGINEFNQRAAKIKDHIIRGDLELFLSSAHKNEAKNQERVDILALFDGAELFQHTGEYSHLFSTKLFKQARSATARLLGAAHPVLSEGNKVVSGTGIYEKTFLTCFYTQLESLIEQAKQQHIIFPITIVLESLKHAICVGYLSEESKWVFFNTNLDMSIHFCNSAVGLAEATMIALSKTETACLHYELDGCALAQNAYNAVVSEWHRAIEKLSIMQRQLFINKVDSEGVSWLHMAAKYGNTDTLSALLESGADINLTANKWGTALFIAAQSRHISAVRLLLKKGADVNRASNKGETPLLLASQDGFIEGVQLLLEYGAGINFTSDKGLTALYIAAQNGHVLIVRLLLKNGAEINLTSGEGKTPLYIAAQNGHVPVVKLLLENGADVNLASNEKVAPLYIAAQQGHTEVVALLLSAKNILVDQEGRSGHTSLHLASQHRHITIVSLLLKYGADVNHKNNEGETPLLHVSQDGCIEGVQLLLENGADVNLASDNGLTALYIAAQNGHVPVVKLLLENGTDVNLASNEKVAPLYIAAQEGHTEVVALLLSIKDIPFDQVAENGFTPLLIATQHGQIEVVKFLLKKGAVVSREMKNGLAPLHMAAYMGHADIIKILVGHGADVNKKTNDGYTPYDFALNAGHAAIVSLLQKYQKTSSSVCILDSQESFWQMAKQSRESEGCNALPSSPTFSCCLLI